MKKMFLTIKVDKDLRADVHALARELGIPLSLVITSFMREFLVVRTCYFTAMPTRRSAVRALREFGYRLGELHYQTMLDAPRPLPKVEQAIDDPE